MGLMFHKIDHFEMKINNTLKRVQHKAVQKEKASSQRTIDYPFLFLEKTSSFFSYSISSYILL